MIVPWMLQKLRLAHDFCVAGLLVWYGCCRGFSGNAGADARSVFNPVAAAPRTDLDDLAALLRNRDLLACCWAFSVRLFLVSVANLVASYS